MIKKTYGVWSRGPNFEGSGTLIKNEQSKRHSFSNLKGVVVYRALKWEPGNGRSPGTESHDPKLEECEIPICESRLGCPSLGFDHLAFCVKFSDHQGPCLLPGYCLSRGLTGLLSAISRMTETMCRCTFPSSIRMVSATSLRSRLSCPCNPASTLHVPSALSWAPEFTDIRVSSLANLPREGKSIKVILILCAIPISR